MSAQHSTAVPHYSHLARVTEYTELQEKLDVTPLTVHYLEGMYFQHKTCLLYSYTSTLCLSKMLKGMD